MHLPPPQGLQASTLALDGEEFVVFSWSADSVAGLTKLSAAEREVLGGIARGASNREIAHARGVSVRTVANQVASLLRKLGASSRYELMRRYDR